MKFIKYLFTMMIATTFFVGCDNDDDDVAKVSGDNIETIIAGTPELSIFKAAIERAKLQYFFNGPGPFTVFAPTNAAFNASGIATAADLNSIDTNLLATVLTYHLQPLARTSFEIPNGPNANMTTQGGLSFYSAKNTTGIYINGVKLVTSDIRASNGIIHTIDGVLIPPVNNSLNTLAANPNHKLFVQAINKSATTANINAALVTVFAPTNAAMVAGGYDSTTIANLNAAGITTLGNIVKYHIYTGRLFSSEFKDGNVKTVQGTNVVLSGSGTKIKGTTNATPFNIVARNITVSNGVIHTIDGLLKY